MKIKTWIEFVLSDFKMTQEELTALLQILPSGAENKGQIYKSPVKGREFKIQRNSWSLSSGLPPDADFETHLVRLLEKLRPAKDKIKLISSQANADLNVVIHTVPNESPYIGWGSRIMKELAEYNCSWGIDISIYESEDDLNE